jgi:hypothetical protein
MERGQALCVINSSIAIQWYYTMSDESFELIASCVMYAVLGAIVVAAGLFAQWLRKEK